MQSTATIPGAAAWTARRRTVAILAGLFGLALAANAVWMLADPGGWYGAVPRVGDTGPYNPHFVRDVAVTYLGLALALGLAAWRPGARPAVLWFAALLLGLHALLHLWDVAAARLPLDHLWIDLPGVFLPPLLAAWLARRSQSEALKGDL